MIAYDEVNTRVALIADPNDVAAPWKQNSWLGYSSAWNGVATRMRSAIEYSDEFAMHLSNGNERYLEERALFSCIVGGAFGD